MQSLLPDPVPVEASSVSSDMRCDAASDMDLAMPHDQPAGWGPAWLPAPFSETQFFYNKNEKQTGKTEWFNSKPFAPRTTGALFGNQLLLVQQQQQQSEFFFKFTDDNDDYHFIEKSSASSRVPRHIAPQRFAPAARRPQQQQQGAQQGQRMQQQRWNQQQPVFKNKDPSIKIEPTWETVFQYEFPALTKVVGEIPTTVEDLKTVGCLYPVDTSLERLSYKMPKNLTEAARQYNRLNVCDDPIMKELASNDEGDIFVTDDVLAALMCTTRSINPWDIVATKKGDQIFLDAKLGEGKPLKLSVNENSLTPPEDSDSSTTIGGVQTNINPFNTASALSNEAELINSRFAQQSIYSKSEEKLAFEPCESLGLKEGISIAHRYRRWNLGDLRIVVRSQIDGITKGNNFVNIHALNEYDSKISEWKQKLENQSGLTIANEMRNNSNKMGRWGLQATLAGAKDILIGFVTRRSGNTQHSVVCGKFLKTSDAIAQMNISLKNAWGIASLIFKPILAAGDGVFHFVKNPNKPLAQWLKEK
eukprot:TRINITY_DN1457_c0_g1_i1.p1 TRINITY_DN1457_c0_g1~~TRINITY_DN1457_c0_g1_i1.p1  ORF type:complete len:532 (+),score=161.34 TRINITY_DN1457_c0_g1_i1:1-1596(+)